MRCPSQVQKKHPAAPSGVQGCPRNDTPIGKTSGPGAKQSLIPIAIPGHLGDFPHLFRVVDAPISHVVKLGTMLQFLLPEACWTGEPWTHSFIPHAQRHYNTCIKDEASLYRLFQLPPCVSSALYDRRKDAFRVIVSVGRSFELVRQIRPGNLPNMCITPSPQTSCMSARPLPRSRRRSRAAATCLCNSCQLRRSRMSALRM